MWFVQQTKGNIVISSHTDDQIEIDCVNSFCVTVTKYPRETTKGEIIVLLLSMVPEVHSSRVGFVWQSRAVHTVVGRRTKEAWHI